jgi:hypothetical protein
LALSLDNSSLIRLGLSCSISRSLFPRSRAGSEPYRDSGCSILILAIEIRFSFSNFFSRERSPTGGLVCARGAICNPR